MIIGTSGVGCSVITLNSLENSSFQPVKRFKDSWSDMGYYWDTDYGAPSVNVYSKGGIKKLVTCIKKVHPTGVVIFADNETLNGNGSRLAKLLRAEGYRVDESDPYVNENHREPGESKRDADKCVLYTWYWQAKVSNREEKSSVPTERQSAAESVREHGGRKANNRPKSKAFTMGARAPVRKATRKAA